MRASDCGSPGAAPAPESSPRDSPTAPVWSIQAGFAVAAEGFGDLQSITEHVARHAGHLAEPQRLGSVDVTRGEDEVEGVPGADDAGQCVADADGEAAAVGRAVDGRDDRLA
jgi:hypothetical protein